MEIKFEDILTVCGKEDIERNYLKFCEETMDIDFKKSQKNLDNVIKEIKEKKTEEIREDILNTEVDY